MARICLIGPNQLGSNPRLVRNADCLAAAGHDVTVVYPDHLPRFRTHDAAIIARARWRAAPIDFCGTGFGRLRGSAARLRRRFLQHVRRPAGPLLLLRAYGYFGPELAARAAATDARFYIAQQQVSAIPAAVAARRTRGRFAVDVEDLVSDCTEEPVELVRQVERLCFPAADFVCTMSEAAAERLSGRHPLRRAPVVLHNCMPLAERGTLSPPDGRPAGSPLSLYWFGQTIGPHSCAELVLRAIARVPAPVRLTLRGANSQGDYLSRLRTLCAELRLPPGTLEIASGASPESMVLLAGEHPVCLGTQPGTQLFHQLAVGNKVFTGLMAGCALALTDTTAHRRLLAAHDGWAFRFSNNDPLALAEQLTALVNEPARLAALRDRAWSLATRVYNWETESARLVAAVRETFSS